MRLWALGKLDTSARHDADDATDPDDSVDELDAAAASFGLRVVGPRPTEEAFWLWPETLPYWFAWHQVQTQWRWLSDMRAARRTGLDYAGVERWLATHGWAHRRQRSLRAAMDAIAVAERAALTVWSES
ncbi:DUF1799 domain-containing protein [Hydrogenophaga taeniospiralis]|uniref:DUF1799 domain-containing protein n=1 Tax=Hydrogenophaga taeniospiralis TaxID=65656 RepID=UPI001CF98149|nr:DUF1799 domain-containing protein [Hydrogenophaga taeniospiralis]MCB4365401.1 DUF1799 domain-containing protein [Hydrogenophaga taeniospiralis]